MSHIHIQSLSIFLDKINLSWGTRPSLLGVSIPPSPGKLPPNTDWKTIIEAKSLDAEADLQPDLEFSSPRSHFFFSVLSCEEAEILQANAAPVKEMTFLLWCPLLHLRAKAISLAWILGFISLILLSGPISYYSLTLH